MNQARSETEPDFFNYQPDEPDGPSTGQWQETADRFRGIDDDDPLRIPETRLPRAVLQRIGDKILRALALDLGSQPTTKPDRPLNPYPPKQALRRRIGAAALALAIGVGGAAWLGPKVFDPETDPYDVSNRVPTDEEVCASRQVGQQPLLVVAAEFTNDLSSRRAAAKRIGQATSDQADDRFGVCYSHVNDYSRVLTDEAIDNLPADRLVGWEEFPGRTQADR